MQRVSTPGGEPPDEGAHQLYHAYSIEEDQDRTNVHYEHHPDFFYLFTGGEWNVYSCNLWDPDVTTDTESQERHGLIAE